MIKTTGAEWKKFYSDPIFWPEGYWHEDEEITVNGASAVDNDIDLYSVDDAAMMTISGGIVCKDKIMDYSGPSLESYFNGWRKKQDTAFISVSCPKDKVELIKKAIMNAGGSVK